MSRVLIIEDELAIAELEKDYLELSDFEVVIEENGVKGCERALAEDFDIFVLDLMLPDMDGFEICRRIRQVENTPILMVLPRKRISTRSVDWDWARMSISPSRFHRAN